MMDLATLLPTRLTLATVLVLVAAHTCSATPGKVIFYEGKRELRAEGRQAEKRKEMVRKGEERD